MKPHPGPDELRSRANDESRDSLEMAVDAVFDRVASTLDSVGGAFPVYSQRGSAWHVSHRGNWASGFWVALLALLARRTADPRVAQATLAAAAKTRHWLARDTALTAMVVWYGTAGFSDVVALGDELLEEAARRLAKSYDRESKLIAPEGEPSDVSLDALAAVTALFAWAQNRLGGEYGRMARANFETHIRLCVRDGCVQTPVALDGTHVAGTRSDWSRGHAWGLLACAEAARVLDRAYCDVAAELVATWERATRSTHGIPHWNLRGAVGPIDTSAAAIAATALLKLSIASGRLQGHYVELARATLEQIARRHVTLSGPTRGAISGGCFDFDSNLVASGELIWGTYFFVRGAELARSPNEFVI